MKQRKWEDTALGKMADGRLSQGEFEYADSLSNEDLGIFEPSVFGEEADRAAYFGFTEDEWALYEHDHDCLSLIINARRKGEIFDIHSYRAKQVFGCEFEKESLKRLDRILEILEGSSDRGTETL